MMTLNPYALSLIVTAAISLVLAFVGWRRRRNAAGRIFVLLMGALTIWSLGYAAELASSDVIAMRRWVVVQYVGIVTIPVFWLLFTLSYSGMGKRIGWQHYATLFVMPSISLLLNASNERWHMLFYREIKPEFYDTFSLLVVTPGPWFWLHTLYSYGVILAGALILLRLWLQTPSLYRQQVTLMLLGAGMPLVMNVIYLSGASPWPNLDLSPFGFTATGMLVAIGLFRFGLFDLNPIARNSLFEALRNPVLVLDEQGRISDLNQATQRLLGAAMQNQLGKPVAQSLATWPQLAAFCSEHGEGRMEFAWCSEPLQAYEVFRTPLNDQQGRLLGQIVVFHDITVRYQAERERLALERQMLHAQKLESLGVLAGGIAHDFNNLLMSIIGNLDLARLDLDEEHPAQGPLGDAERATRRASDLTRQLQAYAGKGSVMLRPINLSQLLTEMMTILQISIKHQSNIQIEFDLANDLPRFEGDSNQIQQAVINLISNAAEALGKAGGTITFSTGVDSYSAAALVDNRVERKINAGTFIYLRITDDGSGMDAATSERMFEPFFTTKEYGRGIGLATVMGVMRSHHGAILVESSPGVGSSLTLLFPVAEA
ncbi:histidine kinase N-terminal 7TM domain-containing protein [Candidatus Viridilinea mediisalina]|uniref:histidine kinase n=1 Tax=Candidatus Viridilinea mediisalina TaxID=2024553 RepID=A0A2A6RJU4_9CHLR|nr:histidine kinase N-terminal 7TM domain-containing protein [Candidatus Viridilinea mediisalina]PDW03128.1 hypothetical protein CJ255_10450 [Candidatus Viridilinea mediisalina]